ncbi:MAG: PD-(D/E)XK nuclease family protein [Vicinamibacteraceae bacterium]
MAVQAVVSASARVRIDAATAFVAGWPAATELVVVAASRDAADDVCRALAVSRGATFGLHRFTLGQLASRIATATLAAAGVTPATALATDALATRALFELARDGQLGYLAPIADSPGLPRALSDTLGELREADVAPSRLAALGAAGPDLGRLAERYAALLAAGGLADRASLLGTATARLRAGDAGGLPPAPIVFVDVPIATVAEQAFVAALMARAPATLATLPAGDARTLSLLPPPLAAAVEVRDDGGTDAIAQVRRHLFAGDALTGVDDDSVRFFSAPGEAREAVEVARRILDEAGRGVPFDEMAIVVRAPESYWGPIEQALERARVPAWFSRGTRRPDPTGRAFLALLACAADDLSARSFAEYLSLGQVPRRDPQTKRVLPVPLPLVASLDEAASPGQLSLFDMLEQAGATPEAPSASDEAPPIERTDVRAPWRWESLLGDAAVASEVGPTGRAARWHRRLGGLRAELELRLRDLQTDEPDSGAVAAIERDLDALDDLSRFALPLVDELAALPAQARWGEWLDRLTGLAPRALRHPVRVLELLADLRPMTAVGPVTLAEVRRVLLPRLAQLDREPPKHRFGRVFVATPDALRGRTFRVVFVVGLAERVFPQRSREDPLLLDTMRAALGAPLAVEEQRVAGERLRLRLAVGAASERCWLSYPRLDVGQGRARVPSFYALDVVRASTGAVPDYVRFERDTAIATGAWLAWPAPDEPATAIDVWEHDLAVLGRLLRPAADPPARGAAHYLLELNPALARSLRTRWSRWKRTWSAWDGLVGSHAEVQRLLADQRLTARPYSVSALQRFAACPYQFLLGAIYRFQPIEQSEAIVQLDPLTRGAIFHEIQRDVLRALRSRGLLPVPVDRRGEVHDILRDVATAVFATHHDRLAPAIERVWEDEITLMHGDLRLWLTGVAASSAEWVPRWFELSFGLPIDDAHDEASVPDPIVIDDRFPIRGAIDLVEMHGTLGSLRVTDHKTGRNRTTRGLVVGGGGTLQPIVYTLVAERLLGRPVSYARLSYATTAGGFTEHPVSVRDDHRRAGIEVLEIIDRAVEAGALPQAPRKGACQWCDFRAVCGPLEEQRAARKNTRLGVLDDLSSLRGMP